MRLRNIKNAKERLMVDNNRFYINEPLNYKGKWNQLFNNSNPIHVEIGCGKGQFISTLAKLNPDINYIAIEKYDSVLLRCLEKVIDSDLNNLKLITFDASELRDLFSDKENLSKKSLAFSIVFGSNDNTTLTEEMVSPVFENLQINIEKNFDYQIRT